MASVSDNHKIVLKGRYTEGGVEHEEGILTGAAYPGMNLVMQSLAAVHERHYYTVGSTDYVGTGTGITTTKAPIMLLKEDVLQGRTVDDVYTTLEVAFIHICSPGEIVQVLVASGQTVTKNDALSAGTDGKWTVDATNGAVHALEDSGGALGADTLVRVRVL